MCSVATGSSATWMTGPFTVFLPTSLAMNLQRLQGRIGEPKALMLLAVG